MGFAGSLVQLTCSLTYVKEKWNLPLGWSENLVLAQGREHVTGTTKPEVNPQAEVYVEKLGQCYFSFLGLILSH